MDFDFKKLRSLIIKLHKEKITNDSRDMKLIIAMSKSLLRVNQLIPRIKKQIDVTVYSSMEIEGGDKIRVYNQCNECYQRLVRITYGVTKFKKFSNDKDIMEEIVKIVRVCLLKMNEIVGYMIAMVDKKAFQLRSDSQLRKYCDDLPNPGLYERLKDDPMSCFNDFEGTHDLFPDEGLFASDLGLMTDEDMLLALNKTVQSPQCSQVDSPPCSQLVKGDDNSSKENKVIEIYSFEEADDECVTPEGTKRSEKKDDGKEIPDYVPNDKTKK